MTPPSDEPWLHYQAAVKAAEILVAHGHEAYLIGGAVRDLLLGQLPKDFDLVTNATPTEILRLPEFERARYQDAAQAFGVTRVTVELLFDGQSRLSDIEIATYRRDIEAHLGRRATKIEFAHLEDDLLRRDLTINALAFDPLNSYLVDEVGGLDDLEHKLVRFIGTPAERINEDPLRILRAIRLKNQLGFRYHRQTAAGLREAIARGDLAKVAADRVRAELTRMLVHSSRVMALVDLDSLGALAALLPELVAAKGVKQPAQFHSEGDVYEHTLLALASLPARPSPQLAWAALLHDIGKPATQTRPAGDRIRFNEHTKVGSSVAADILKRFNFSKKTIDHISWMVHYHLAIDELPKMRPGHQRQMMAHPAFADLFELHKADAKASLGKLPDGTLDASQPEFPEIERLWQQYQLQAHTQPLSLKAEFGIDGDWLMAEYGLAKGPELGSILEQLNQAYLNGEITSSDQAKALASKIVRRPQV